MEKTNETKTVKVEKEAMQNNALICAAVRHLYEWQYTGANHFTAELYRLIAKADSVNRARIAVSFPVESLVFHLWQSMGAEEFFNLFGLTTKNLEKGE